MRCRGFTILETLVAGVLLSMVMMILFSLYPSSLVAVHRGEHMVDASTLAQSILERYRTMPFSRLRALAPTPGGAAVPTDVAAPPPESDQIVLTPSVTVFLIPGMDVEPIRVVGVRATVTWNERDHPKQYSSELWICDIKR